MLGYALRENGYEVATAATGYLALEEVAKRDPDLILLDLYLSGGMNGGEFLAQYRSSGGRAKVIVISGAARADPIARDLVVDEFVYDPSSTAAKLTGSNSTPILSSASRTRMGIS